MYAGGCVWEGTCIWVCCSRKNSGLKILKCHRIHTTLPVPITGCLLKPPRDQLKQQQQQNYAWSSLPRFWFNWSQALVSHKSSLRSSKIEPEFKATALWLKKKIQYHYHKPKNRPYTIWCKSSSSSVSSLAPSHILYILLLETLASFFH